MKRFFTLTVLAALMATFAPKQATAQYYDGIGMKGKVIVGGNVGFGVMKYNNRNWIDFELSPQVGYRIIDQLEVGARLVYHLEYSKKTDLDARFSCNYLGIAPYINFEFWRGFYVQAEYEGVYAFVREKSAGVVIRDGKWYNSLPLGIGYRYYLGESGFAYIAGFYNVFDLVNADDHPWAMRPYNSPWIVRLGFCWGF